MAMAQKNCTLQKNEQGIRVSLCTTDSSSFKTIIVEFEAAGTLKAYASGILNVEKYHIWQHSIENIKTLKKITPHTFIYYVEVDSPWPINNRDLIFRFSLTQNLHTKALTIRLKHLPNFIPTKNGIVRIPKAESILIVTPLTATRLHVKYVLQIDPGGEIPPFIANLFAANTPWSTFNAFRNLLEANTFDENIASNIINYQE